jgi:hypothetical protein
MLVFEFLLNFFQILRSMRNLPVIVLQRRLVNEPLAAYEKLTIGNDQQLWQGPLTKGRKAGAK